jgi:hypothetical protein
MTYRTAPNTVGTSGIRKIPTPVYAMLILSIIGIADAAYVAHGNYAGASSGVPLLTDAMLLLIARIRGFLECRCHTSASSIICLCLD